MNRLFVAYKPEGISSNFFLKKIKKKYKVKKAGFSGTLDPFAGGVLIMAFGQFTKLFRFLDKAPKTYRATLWIGADSPTLDIEKIQEVKELMPFAMDSIDLVAKSFIGDIEYYPPKYSAKMIDGRRAYELARKDSDFELKKIKSTIYDFKVLHYFHPFLTFEISISEGGYIRSIGHIFAKKLGFEGSLSSLTRLSEGKFVYENEKELNPLDFISIDENVYLGDMEDIELGRKLDKSAFKRQENGIYKIVDNNHLALIELKDNEVEYVLNKVKLC
ncbi:MAG: tRNA pseudouridine(55) synthase TruB [Sulfurospirillaceae bacterium]|nr:tRNA pseudouridine(55) synthase TruB [Sulfurospirillaceae bacterium]